MASPLPWSRSGQPPWAVSSEPWHSSTQSEIGAWNQGDTLRRHHSEAALVRNFSRRGAWGQLAPLPAKADLGRSEVCPQLPTRSGVAVASQLEEGAPSSHTIAKWNAEMPGSSGPGRLVYMQEDLGTGRLFNVASRGLRGGSQPKWCFDRMPSLLPPPLMRDRGVARSCAGVPPGLPKATTPGARNVLHTPQSSELPRLEHSQSRHARFQ
mmetsp:Transcript_1164/g.1763  ORF Transcript_1164/g.1763 Transcript_1164/m.1763 type:complete len:210 (+) Transcript_1164:17-646(+)